MALRKFEFVNILVSAYKKSSCARYRYGGLVDSRCVELEALDRGKGLFVDGAIDEVELQNLIQNCARMKSISKGKCCHGLAVHARLLDDTLMCNVLINFYSKCVRVDLARSVFDRMTLRSMVSWNTMIAAYSQLGEPMQALELFLQMRREETSVSEFTLSSVLCACSSRCAVGESKQLHALALKISFDSNVFVATAVLDVYAKSHMIDDAMLIFHTMPVKSSVTWSSMVAGYVQNEHYEEALKLFNESRKMSVEMTKFTLSAALSACASIAAILEGTQLHVILVKTGLGFDLFVATSLIDVYSKCGRIREAYVVFFSMQEKNIVVWNAMISGFSRHASPLEAMILFEKMQQAGMQPNEVTYISVLSACSHVGLVEKGRGYFNLLLKDDAVQPNVLHYSCMVDVLGRAGLVDEAWELIQQMPYKPTSSMWGSLLGSCRIHGNVKFARIAAQHLFELEPDNAGNHVLLSNIFAAHRQWEDVVTARKNLKDSGAKKETGKSWIEVKREIHIFTVGENNHPRIQDIYTKLSDLMNEMKKSAYKAEIHFDLHDVEVDQKEELLSHHSERLALAFGLITMPEGIPIRIYKNLRICGDCHQFMKFASSSTTSEIIVRDTNRFHHFKGGICSCGDFW